jgi:hypothetical protein
VRARTIRQLLSTPERGGCRVTSILPPICSGCTHLNRSSDLPLLDPKCDAFPAGIPNEILLSKADHREPFPGDNGIQFEPQDAKAAKYAEMIFDPTPTR